MPNYRSTLIVFALAVTLSSVAIWTWQHGALSADTATPRFALFDQTQRSLPVDSVTRIELARRGEPTMVFERQGGRWSQIEPFQFPMDAFSMRSFAVAASSLTAVSELTPEQVNAASMGFDPPLATLTFSWDHAEQVIHFGRRTVGGRGYVRLDDTDPVYVVSKELHDRVIDMDPKEWRKRDIFLHAGVDSSTLSYQSPASRFTITREDGAWQLTSPIRARLDQAKAEEFVARFGAAKLDEFILDQPSDLSQFGLDDPSMVFEVQTPVRNTPEDATTRRATITERLLIGAPRGAQGASYFAMREGGEVVFALMNESLAEMLAVDQLLDLTVSDANPADVYALRINGPDAQFDIERDPANPAAWISSGDARQPVDGQIVGELLRLLTEVPATRIEAGTFDPENQVGYIIMFGADRRPIDTVRIEQLASGEWSLDIGGEIQRIYPSSMQLPLAPSAFGLR